MMVKVSKSENEEQTKSFIIQNCAYLLIKTSISKWQYCGKRIIFQKSNLIYRRNKLFLSF